jgi:hypothetical protein
MTILQKAATGAALLAMLGVGMFEAHHSSKLGEEIQALRQEQRSLTERLSRLEEEHDKTKQQLSALHNSPQPASRSDTTAKPHRIEEVASLPSVGLEDELDRACTETSLGKREAAQKYISKAILSSDIPRALAHLATRPGMSGVESPLFSDLAAKWGESAPSAATVWASGLSDPSAQKIALVGILKGWTHIAPEAAAGYAANLPAGDLQDAAVLKVVNEWSFRDAAGVAAWVSRFPGGDLRDKALGPIIFWGQGQCPAAIADMLDTIGNPQLIKEHGETLASVWLSRDAAAARTWIDRSPLPDDAKQRLLRRADEQK